MKSYKVYHDTSRNKYIAYDTIEKEVDYSNSNGREATQWALDHLTSGRTTKEIVTLDLSLGGISSLEFKDDGLHIPSYTQFHWNNELKLAPGLAIPFAIIDTPQNHDIDIIADYLPSTNKYGSINGNESNYRSFSGRYSGILVGDQRHASLRNIYNISVQNANVHDTINSNILIEANQNMKNSNNINISNNIKVLGCKLSNSCKDHNVYVSSGKGITVDNCKISGFSYNEIIAIGSGSGSGIEVKDSYITNNKIRNLTPNPTGVSANYVINSRTDKSDNITIKKNDIDVGNQILRNNVIELKSEHNIVTNNTIKGTLKSSSSFMINVYRSNQNLAYNNIVANRGIIVTNQINNLRNITINNNTINCTDQCLRIISSTYQINDLEAKYNYLYGCPLSTWIREERSGTGTWGPNVHYSNNNVHGVKYLDVPEHESDNTVVVCP